MTGANSGIGFEAARDLVGRGAHVVFAVRDTAKGERAAASLAGSGSTSIVELDLSGRSGLASVSKIATTVLLQSAAAGARSTLRALDDSTPSGAFVGPARLGQLRGRPKLLDVYASGKDPATAARLWVLTEQALGGKLPV